MLKYIELKTGYRDNGPAWIARIKLSKSGRTVYFNGRALKRGSSHSGNFIDLETRESFWISGVKRDGSDRHWAGAGKIQVEAAALDEYLSIIGETELDKSRFAITHDIREADSSAFVDIENEASDGPANR